VGERAKLLTHLLVREDARTLYGFATAAELELFERLLTVRGAGPARALALLSGASVEALRAAIAGADAGALTRLPGVGQRLAAQLVLDLKDKVGPAAAEAGVAGEVLAWLTAMGFPPAEARAAVAKLPPDAALPLEERAVRELAHVFHQQAPVAFAREWRTECFGNLGLHAPVAAAEPAAPPQLTASPAAVAAVAAVGPDAVPHHRLAAFEALYEDGGPLADGWSQCRQPAAARRVYAAGASPPCGGGTPPPCRTPGSPRPSPATCARPGRPSRIAGPSEGRRDRVPRDRHQRQRSSGLSKSVSAERAQTDRQHEALVRG
jgi:holliday junction DNA helicase RuvA